MASETTQQLIQILAKTVSPDHNELYGALTYLEQLSQTNLPEYTKALSDILAGVNNPPVPRMAAGLQLKNTLTSKDVAMKLEYQRRWMSMLEETRNYIKKNVVSALGTETFRPSAAAQCVAYIAVAELPMNQWPNLIRQLVTNVTSPNSAEMLREATLEAIGYICQDIDPDILALQSNEVLTAIVHGMKNDEKNDHVKLAATTALFNSLEFTRANFEKDNERDYIMQVIWEAIQSTNTKIKVAALQCLVKIMSLYYRYMETYMRPALFPISLEAMKSDIDEVTLQGIEFWSNVCDEEVDLAVEAQEAAEMGKTPERLSQHYALGALQFILPVLLQLLTKQDETDDEEDWNPCKAAGVCLMLVATCCGDHVVPDVLNFVEDNIKSADWRGRDAAVMAFGSILEGPNVGPLQPIVKQALPIFVQLTCDPCVTVRDTTAWTIGRICEITPDVVNIGNIQSLLEALITGLKSEPRVATNLCWALNSLASSVYEKALQDSNDDDGVATYLLSPFFSEIVDKLFETTDRPDANQNNLRTAAYEALMEFIKNSPKDCYAHIVRATEVILTRLIQVLQMESSISNMSDRSQFSDLQSLLCATLQSIIRKMTKEDAMRIGDVVMQALLHTLNSSMRHGSGGVQEDAIMAVSSLAEVIGEDFVRYMDAFKPFLYAGLKNVNGSAVCQAAVGVVSDICRALGPRLLPYCNEIMITLVESLNNANVNPDVIPEIVSAFGDIAMAIGPKFGGTNLDIVLNTLYQASKANVDRSDYDSIEYLNKLREGCLETYTSIIQGLRDEMGAPTPVAQQVHPHVPHIVGFILAIAQDPDRTEAVSSAAAGLIGDLCTVFGESVAMMLDVPPVQELLTECHRSKSHKVKTVGQWATMELKKHKAGVPAS